MKHSSIWFALILIASALLLNAESADTQSPSANAPSKPPTIQSHEPTPDTQSDVNQRNPPQIAPSPLEAEIAETLRAIERDQQTASAENQASEKRWWPPSPSWAIVYVTIAYVIVAIFQWRMINRQADIAERALTRDKVPYLFVTAVPAPKAAYMQLPFGRRVSVTFSIRNAGNGPAVFRSLIFQCAVTQNLGPYRHERPIDPYLPPGYVIAAGETMNDLSATPVEVSKAAVSDEEWIAIERTGTSKLKIFLYGLINYTDIWNTEWTAGLAWIYDAELFRFRIATEAEAPGYNYRRQEKEAEKSPLEWLRRLIGGRRRS